MIGGWLLLLVSCLHSWWLRHPSLISALLIISQFADIIPVLCLYETPKYIARIRIFHSHKSQHEHTNNPCFFTATLVHHLYFLMTVVSPPVQPGEVLQGAPLDVPQTSLMSPWARPRPLTPRGPGIRLEVRETFVNAAIITHTGDPTAVGVTQRGHADCLYLSTLSLSLYSLIVDVSAVDTGLLWSGAREGNSGNLRPSDTATQHRHQSQRLGDYYWDRRLREEKFKLVSLLSVGTARYYFPQC